MHENSHCIYSKNKIDKDNIGREKLLTSRHTKHTMQVKWSTCLSDPFAVTNGVRQEGVFTPNVFAIYIDKLCSVGAERDAFRETWLWNNGCWLMMYVYSVVLTSVVFNAFWRFAVIMLLNMKLILMLCLWFDALRFDYVAEHETYNTVCVVFPQKI